MHKWLPLINAITIHNQKIATFEFEDHVVFDNRRIFTMCCTKSAANSLKGTT